jgi:hypothetical protein
VARNIVITILVVLASLMLAVLLFVAGAIWRGRATSGTMNFSNSQELLIFSLARNRFQRRDFVRIVGKPEVIRLVHGRDALKCECCRAVVSGAYGWRGKVCS